ncbi:MAG: insulinase family protein [Gammaproteobacteria bacterium]|nr:insulinase family protein [Gammaproteobacteria bacterium]
MIAMSRWIPGLLVACLVALFAARAAPAGESPVKSPTDPRDYATFTLENGMRALIISDPDTDKAAAALDVAVGSSADPTDRQGLAHFLEHMLFLGTDKYPDAGEYQEFINRHGGSHNAFTAFEDTNYFFDIDKDQLEPALDRFSQFFVAPLFNPEYVEREVKAVYSEYQARLKDDYRRTYAVMQSVMNPAHPVSTFAVGSLETLADRPGRPVRADLVRFYAQHYSANLMTVVVLGKEPLDVLERWVREKFGPVPNREAAPLAIDVPMFLDGTLPQRVDVLPVKDRRSLSLSFPLPPLKGLYRTKPIDYIANLVGHEGEGSVLAALKRRGWVDTLSAGTSLDNRDAAMFSVNITLTRDGSDHVEEIVDHVFDYLDLIRDAGIDEWRFREQSRLYDLRFAFQEKAQPIGYVSDLAGNLQYYPPADVLRLPYLADDYEPDVIASMLARLTRQNVLITYVAPEVHTDRTEKWYDTPYAVLPPEQATGSARDDGIAGNSLALPAANPFIPERIAVKPVVEPARVPVRLDGAGGVELWHQQDSDFPQPRASFYFSVRSAVANDSPAHAVLTDLYVRMVKDQLNEFAYPATLAGLSYDVYRHVRGFTVKVSGFDDRQHLLLEAICGRLRTPVIAADRFKVAREELIRELENTRKEPPYAQAMNEINTLLVRPGWTVDQRLAAIAPLAVRDLRAFVPKLLENVYVIALAHGNVVPDEARALAAVVDAAMLGARQPADVPPASVVKLAASDYFGREIAMPHPDSAIAVYVQGPDKRYPSRALMELFGQMVSAPFYGDLRTEQQLGYVVFAGPLSLLDVPGVMFIVQSPVADPAMLETHVQAFLHDYRSFIAGVDEDTFAAHRQGVITRILEHEDRLQDRSDRYWQELDLGYTRFDSRERLAGAVAQLTREELLAFYDDNIIGGKERRLTVRALGENHTAVAGAVELAPHYRRIDSAETFGEGMAYYGAGAHPDPAVPAVDAAMGRQP